MKQSSRPTWLFIVGFCAFLALVARYPKTFLTTFWGVILGVLICLWLTTWEAPRLWRKRTTRSTPPLFAREAIPDQVLLTVPQVPTQKWETIRGTCDVCGRSVQNQAMWLAEDRKRQKLFMCDGCRDSLILKQRATTPR